MFTTYLTNRLTDRTDYAAYLDLYAYTSVLIVVFSFRMDTALFRFGKRLADLPRVYGTSLIPVFVSAGAILLLGYQFADVIADWLTYPNKTNYIVWFCWIISFDIVNLIPFAKLRLEGRAKLFVFYKLLNVLLTIGLVILFVETNLLDPILRLFPMAANEVDSVFIANLIVSAFLFIVLMCAHFPRVLKVDFSLWQKMILYSAPLIVVGVAANVNQYFAVPLQKFLLGAEIDVNKDQAAVYGAVQKIAALLALFTTAFNYAAEPFFFRHSDRSDAKDIYGRIALYFVMAAGVVSVTIYSLLDIFQLVIGVRYRDDLYLIPILLMAYVFLGMYYNVSIWYKLSDRTIYGAYISSVGALITLVGSLLFLPIFGVASSAWLALLCYMVMVLLAWQLGKSRYPISYPVYRIGQQLLVLIIALLACWVMHETVDSSIGYGLIILTMYVAVIGYIERRSLSTLL